MPLSLFYINFESNNMYLKICADLVHKCELKLISYLIKLAVNILGVQETIVLKSKNKAYSIKLKITKVDVDRVVN